MFGLYYFVLLGFFSTQTGPVSRKNFERGSSNPMLKTRAMVKAEDKVPKPDWHQAISFLKPGPGNRRRNKASIALRLARMKMARQRLKWNDFTTIVAKHGRVIESRRAFRKLRTRARKALNHAKLMANRKTGATLKAA